MTCGEGPTLDLDLMARVDLECLADELLAARQAQGLSQAEVAARAGINQATVSRIEAAERHTQFYSLARYARAVGLLLTVEGPNYWTTTDVAAYLGVKVGTVSSYRSRGQMPAPDAQHGRTAVWRPETIRAWRADHE